MSKFGFTLVAALCLANAALAASKQPYVWAKDIGHNRVERGTHLTLDLQPIVDKDGIGRLAMACAADEILINGGCSAVYGFTLSSSFPFTSTSSSVSEWVCVGQPDLESALTGAGNKPTPATPKSDLVGGLQVVLTCEKLAKPAP